MKQNSKASYILLSNPYERYDTIEAALEAHPDTERYDWERMDSQAELERLYELMIMQRAGLIRNLRVHPKFQLLGKRRSYTPDFCYERRVAINWDLAPEEDSHYTDVEPFATWGKEGVVMSVDAEIGEVWVHWCEDVKGVGYDENEKPYHVLRAVDHWKHDALRHEHPQWHFTLHPPLHL